MIAQNLYRNATKYQGAGFIKIQCSKWHVTMHVVWTSVPTLCVCPPLTEQKIRPTKSESQNCPNFVPTSVTRKAKSVRTFRSTYIGIIGGPRPPCSMAELVVVLFLFFLYYLYLHLYRYIYSWRMALWSSCYVVYLIVSLLFGSKFGLCILYL